MKKRAESLGEIRERILKATMSVHDEKGVVPTTYADIAERAGVGVATVYRHFPKVGELVMACGGHVWAELQPPMPNTVEATFAGLTQPAARIARMVEELDALYERGELRLRLASRDRELMAELDGFLRAVEAGVEALVREGLKGTDAAEDSIKLIVGLLSFRGWQGFSATGLPAKRLRQLKIRLVHAAVEAGRES
jgi:AcrR family transcriptional regulator